jgi:hypothetical protein
MEGEVVALNVATGIYFSLRGLAAALWEDLAAGHAVETLGEHVECHGAEAGIVGDFAGRLTDHGLMRRSSRDPVVSEPSSIELLRAGPQEIIFEIYDDMQDLILADPIHDVDESMGWPHQKAEHA